MEILEGIMQGSEQWLQIRAKYFTASEASAAAGLSKYVSRTDLLKQKSTGLVAEVDGAKQRLFDAGHASEAAARPLVEAKLGEELYPCTCVAEIDGLPLLASLDGMTMDGSIIWETKLSNANLRDDIVGGELEAHYWMQIEQQLLVTGAEKCYFTASDGTPEGTIGLWYESRPERRTQLIAVWKQFAVDLAAYQHVEVIPAAVAAPIQDLPALNIQINGSVVASNLAQWKDVVVARIGEISTSLQTDTDFATAESTVKFLDEGEKKIDLVKAQAQAQASDIDTVFRAMDEIKAMMRSKRLELDKLVKARKESIRVEIMQAAQAKLAEHVKNLNARIGWHNGCPIISPAAADFATAIKGKKTVASLRDACDTELARAKIATSELADRIEANRKAMGEHVHLFPDFGQACTKAPDDFANLVSTRVQQHQAAEAAREETARQRIRAEEEARAAARVRAEQEAAARTAPEATRVANDEARPATTLADVMHAAAPAAIARAISPEDSVATLKLGEINERLGFTVSADFLAKLGFHATTERSAKLYREGNFMAICAAIAGHVSNVGSMRKAA